MPTLVRPVFITLDFPWGARSNPIQPHDHNHLSKMPSV